MKSKFFFLATVVNASSRIVRIQVEGAGRPDATVLAADKLYGHGLDGTFLQNVSEGQFLAGTSAPFIHEVTVMAPVATVSPTYLV